MANKLTNKKPLFGKSVSHSKRRTNKMQKPNLQTKNIDGVKVTLSNREWKTLKKDAQ